MQRNEEKFDPDQRQELASLLLSIKPLLLEHVSLHEVAGFSPEIPQDHLIQLMATPEKSPDYVLVDVRTPDEYALNHLPGAVNLPILTTPERHDVGLIYKQHDKDLAFSYAFYLARQKEADYLAAAKQISGGRDIILYCWRGGGRSRYATAMLCRNGLPVIRLTGGQRGFRKEIHRSLYEQDLNLYPLSGPTGCGKSALLEHVQAHHPEIPVLHLEAAACHAASVFGEIRYRNLEYLPAINQRDFETRLFMQMLPYRRKDGSYPSFLTENESRKIGNFLVPPSVQRGLEKANHIEIKASLSARVERLRGEYFGDDGASAPAVMEAVAYLTRRIGKKKVAQYQDWIASGEHRQFLTDIVESYYDKVYKPDLTTPIFSVNSDDIPLAAKVLSGFWSGGRGR